MGGTMTTTDNDVETKPPAKELALVECFISKQRVRAADTVEVERNGRRVLVHKRFAPENSATEPAES